MREEQERLRLWERGFKGIATVSKLMTESEYFDRGGRGNRFTAFIGCTKWCNRCTRLKIQLPYEKKTLYSGFMNYKLRH